MNVFNKITLAALSKNRTRTLVTILGVILSVALISGVMTFAVSIHKFLLDGQIEEYGNWHAFLENVDSDILNKINADNRVKTVAVSNSLGYAVLEGSQNEYKPYLNALAIDENMKSMYGLKLLFGRWAENASEVVISDHIRTDGGVVYGIGDVITLPFGKRVASGGRGLLQKESYLNGEGNWFFDGDAYIQTNSTDVESLIDLQQKTYTVVGTIERPTFEFVGSPGYTMITTLDNKAFVADDKIIVYVEMEKPAQVYDFISELNAPENYYPYNNRLLIFYGVSQDMPILITVIMAGLLLLFLIMSTAVLLIHNAFAISVSERSKQFGILSSVGATRKQLLRSVLFEGSFVGMIGIPLGMLAGIGGVWIAFVGLSDTISSLTSDGRAIELAISVPFLAASLAISVVTIFISAYIPARRGTKTSAIEAIRQSADIKLSSKDVKTSKLTEKLFGLEGMLALKSLKRNKKRYRSTVISLFVSIVLFVSVGMFVEYITSIMRTQRAEINYDIIYENTMTKDEAVKLFDSLKTSDNVTESSYNSTFYPLINFETAQVSERYIEHLKNRGYEIGVENETASAFVVFDDDAFMQIFGEDKAFAVKNATGLDKNGRYVNFEIYTTENSSITLTQNGEKIPITTTEIIPMGANFGYGTPIVIYMSEKMAAGLFSNDDVAAYKLVFNSSSHENTFEDLKTKLTELGFSESSLVDIVGQADEDNKIVSMLKIFIYGLVVIISLITVANIFNTISTSVALRRRELAMLRSMGMANSGFNKMMFFESAFYGFKAFLYAVPTIFAIDYLLYIAITEGADSAFIIPWVSFAVCVIGVFAIVGITMMYALGRFRGVNTLEALRSDVM